MANSATSDVRSIKVGVITDLTGALSFMGIANANVAKLELQITPVIEDAEAGAGMSRAFGN